MMSSNVWCDDSMIFLSEGTLCILKSDSRSVGRPLRNVNPPKGSEL